VIVSPESAAVLPALTLKMRNPGAAASRAILTPVAGPVIVMSLLMVSWPVVSATAVPAGSKLMTSGPGLVVSSLAAAIAARSEPAPPSSPLRTVNVAGTVRSSSASILSRIRGCAPRTGRAAGRANALRSQERIVMGNS